MPASKATSKAAAKKASPVEAVEAEPKKAVEVPRVSLPTSPAAYIDRAAALSYTTHTYQDAGEVLPVVVTAAARNELSLVAADVDTATDSNNAFFLVQVKSNVKGKKVTSGILLDYTVTPTAVALAASDSTNINHAQAVAWTSEAVVNRVKQKLKTSLLQHAKGNGEPIHAVADLLSPPLVAVVVTTTTATIIGAYASTLARAKGLRTINKLSLATVIKYGSQFPHLFPDANVDAFYSIMSKLKAATEQSLKALHTEATGERDEDGNVTAADEAEQALIDQKANLLLTQPRIAEHSAALRKVIELLTQALQDKEAWLAAEPAADAGVVERDENAAEVDLEDMTF